MVNNIDELESLMTELHLDIERVKKCQLLYFLKECEINRSVLKHMTLKHLDKFFEMHQIPLGIQILFEQRLQVWQQLNNMDDISQYLCYTNLPKVPLQQNEESEGHIIDSGQTLRLLVDSANIGCNEPTNTFENPELFELLTKWGVQILYDKCIEEQIDLEIMKYMTPRHAELLTKNFKLGILIKFEYNLKKWQMSENSTVVSSVSEGTKSDLCLNSQKHTFEGNKENAINVEDLLQQSSQGRALIERRDKNLNDGCRSILLDILINHLIQNNIKMTVPLAEKLSKEIVTIFPNEIESVYFFKEGGKAPKGKIYAKYFNQLRCLKSSGLVQKRSYLREAGTSNNSRSIDPSLFDSEENIEDHLEAIETDNCSWSEIENHYAATSKHRIIQISQTTTTAEIVKKWKHFKSPLGYKLIDLDFKTLYPEACSLINSIPEYSNRLFQILERRIKDPASLSLLSGIKNIESLSENGRYATILYLLHAVLVPTSKAVKVENGKKVHIKHSIKDSQNSFLIVGNTADEADTILSRKLEKLQAIQPLILITGSVMDPKTIIIFFDGIKYKIFSFIQAVDICFKIFNLFNLEYPLASTLVWNFIQKFFYCIKTKFDKCHPSINLLCSELKQN